MDSGIEHDQEARFRSVLKLVKETVKLRITFAEVEDATPLVSSGLLDSLNLVGLVDALQSSLGFTIADEDLSETNFETPYELASLCSALGVPKNTAPADPIFDGTSPCYSTAFFYDRLAAEVERSQRYRYPLVVALMGIFERATAGRSVTEELSRLGEILAKDTRRSDLACRILGGGGADAIAERDSFGTLVPHTNITGALIRCERLKRNFLRDPLLGTTKSTICIGLASLPQDAKDSASLMAATRRALHAAHQRSTGILGIATASECVEPRVGGIKS